MSVRVTGKAKIVTGRERKTSRVGEMRIEAESGWSYGAQWHRVALISDETTRRVRYEVTGDDARFIRDALAPTANLEAAVDDAARAVYATEGENQFEHGRLYGLATALVQARNTGMPLFDQQTDAMVDVIVTTALAKAERRARAVAPRVETRERSEEETRKAITMARWAGNHEEAERLSADLEEARKEGR